MRFKLRPLSLLIGAMCGAMSLPLHAQLAAGALPTGWNITGGSAAISQTGSTLNINQTTNQALVNFQTFNVGSGAAVVIRQPGATSALLARTTGGDPSQINGQITANGALWLINPAGIMVGAGARIDVGSFVASTLNVSDADFLAGRLTFAGSPMAGAVHNAGSISAASGGSIYLVAPSVTNTGTLEAPHGDVLLAAGQNVQIMDTGTPGISVAISGTAGEARNLGRIVAEAGRIGLAAGLVDNSGELHADSAVREGGRVFLRASGDLTTTAGSNISASGTSGGRVELMAEGAASIDGVVKATGSAGPGGYVDTSGHRTLDVKNVPVVGRGGEWHIDPLNIEIGEGADSGVTGDSAIVSTADGAHVSAATITSQLNQGVNVSITTGTGSDEPTRGDITVSAPIAKTGSDNSALTLNASNNIHINAPITSANSALDLRLNSNFQGGYPQDYHAVALAANLDLHGGALTVSEGAGNIGNGTLDIVGGTTTLGPGSTIDAATVNVNRDGTLALERTGSAISSRLNNYGLVTVRVAGTAVLDHGGMHTGTFDVAAGTGLSMSGGQDFYEFVDFIGTGTVEWAGTISLHAPVVFDAGGSMLVLHDVNLYGSVGNTLSTQGADVVVDGEVILHGSTWNNSANIAVRGDGAISAGNENSSLRNEGTITTSGTQEFVLSGSGAAVSNFVNNGSLVKTGDTQQTFTGIYNAASGVVRGEAGSLTVSGSRIDGEVQVASGARVTLDNVNLSTGVRFTGTGTLGWQNWITLLGSVDIDAAAPVLSLGPDTTLNGQGNVLTTRNTVQANDATLTLLDQTTWHNEGLLRVGAGTTSMQFGDFGGLSNRAGGTVLVDQGTLRTSFDEAHVNNGAIVLQNGGMIDTAGTDIYNNGTLGGSGTLAMGGGTLFNNGTVAPGTSAAAGTLAVQGNYRQGSSGVLQVKLGGGLGAGEFDVLDIDGTAHLAGLLQVGALGSFAPADAATADFIVARGGNGGSSFEQVIAPAASWQGGVATMTVSYPAQATSAARVVVAVVPSLGACTTNPSIAGCGSVLPTLNACTAAPSLAGCSAVLPTLAVCTVSPSLPGCSAVLPPSPPPPPPPAPPPSADICTIAPNSALCQVLTPPTASEPIKPVQQASNEVLKTATTALADAINDQAIAFLDLPKIPGGSGTASAGGDDKLADKAPGKEALASDKTKNEPPPPKMYCN